MKRLKIIVTGFVGLYPTGGVTWDYIQYPLGLKILGHDVYYVEDTGQFSKYTSTGRAWDDPTDTVRFMDKAMRKFELKGRWVYRDVAGNCYGMSYEKLLNVCSTADIFINVSASAVMRDEYLAIPVRVLVDSDPMFTQVQYWDDGKTEESIKSFQKLCTTNYTHLFSFGENIGQEDCRIPTYDLTWQTTRQPICLDFWQKNNAYSNTGAFTTIMNWSSRNKMIYKQEEWGQKDVEFEKVKDIPLAFKNSTFKIIAADNSKNMNHQNLEDHGWQLLDPLEIINTADQYMNFIHESLGEFSVAKETYVKSNSGWFSGRSACYLAAGKPVVTQETRWSKYIPSGQGLFAFSNQTAALDALTQVREDYRKHSLAAKELAREYFDSGKVLSTFIDKL